VILSRKHSCVIAGQILLLAVLNFTSCNQSSKTAGDAGGPSGSANSVVSNAKPGESKELDACKLVTKAEAEEILGEHVKDADSGPASMHGGTICMYGSQDSLSAKNVTIRVESPNFDWNKYKEEKRIEGEKMQPKRGRVRPVPGLGKDAYFARHVLHVLTDHGILTVIIFRDPGDAAAGEEVETKTETAEKVLAEKAVARM